MIPLSRRFGTIAATATALVALALALYAGTAKNEFVWDDPIVFKRQLPFFDSFENVFLPPSNIPQFGVHYYRPLTVVTYQIDEWLAKSLWPMEEREEARRVVYHSSVVVYHGLATLTCFFLGLMLVRATGRRWPDDVVIAGLCGVLFAAHPIHAESVAWMAGRSDVLCTLFLLAALATYLVARRQDDIVKATALGLLFGLLSLASMMSKETGAAVVLAVPLLELLLPATSRAADERNAKRLTRAQRRREQRSKRKRRGSRERAWWVTLLPAWGALAAAVVLYFGLRLTVLNELTSPAPYTATSFVQAVFGSLGWYVVKVFYPPPQNAFVSDLPGTPFIALGLLAPVVWAAAAVVLRDRAGRWTAELVASGLFFVGVAPAMAIALRSISETPIAERYLYLPSAGICLFVSLVVVRLARRVVTGGEAARIAVAALLAALLAVPAGYATIQRAKVWRNDLAFWTDTSRKSPNEGLPHLHLGIAYGQIGDVERSLEKYQEALVKYDDAEGRSKALNNMGSIYLRQQRWHDAIESFKRALQEVPVYATAHYNWALAENSLRGSAQTDEERVQRARNALAHFEKALEINPRYTKAHLQYGALLRGMGQPDRARRHFEAVIQLDPSSMEAQEARRLLQAR